MPSPSVAVKILGIDPGSIYCGYGLIGTTGSGMRRGDGRTSGIRYLSSGRIVLPQKHDLPTRLRELYGNLVEVIEEYDPDEIAVERIFFARGIRAALSLGHTRGVVLLVASMKKRPIYEYSALEIKQAVVGYGRAAKFQVSAMVREILRIGHTLSPDSADALALAICHANTRKSLTRDMAGAAGA